MLGEARGKFNTIAGPEGGTTLNGAVLKHQGLAVMEKLDQDIGNFASYDCAGFYEFDPRYA